MDASALSSLLSGIGVPVYSGYPDSGAMLPYIVHRPLLMDVQDAAICGDAISWDSQQAVYCCGGSVEAANNLSLLVMGALQGHRLSGSTLATSMSYSGAIVEGHYESQVTVQSYQGGLE